MREELNLCELMSLIPEKYSHAEICKMSDTDKELYLTLLQRFKRANGSRASKKEKGDSLENLVSLLLQISGNIFTVIQNIRTETNEIDELVKLNQNGRVLLSLGLIPKRFELFLGECKNHNTSINVGYIGKFCSLLLTTQVKTGILFSYHGISGSGWKDGNGLVKKVYLQRERNEDRVAIIDFCIHDFQAIADGNNFFEIVEKKLAALQFDTSIDSFITEHPAEKTFIAIN